MSDTIAKLAGEFSKEKNITQREVMEVTLVEYLMKYGFKREAEAPVILTVIVGFGIFGKNVTMTD